MYIYIYTYIHIYKHVNICISCMHVCMYVCMYVRTYVCTTVCTDVCKYVCMHACVHIYIYMYIRICVYTFCEIVCRYLLASQSLPVGLAGAFPAKMSERSMVAWQRLMISLPGCELRPPQCHTVTTAEGVQ